jgi:hypothetical protein
MISSRIRIKRAWYEKREGDFVGGLGRMNETRLR